MVGGLQDNGSCQPTTVHEKKRWSGFCELESEPALFNVMLREFGVKGIKVQEVVSLDDEMMAILSKPIYGLIFLFRWCEDDTNKQEASCPEGLWFANQTTSNACASVALLNIVNNIPDADLGENLRQFREFTMPFTPSLRGDAINNFEFVKQIHNSFARKMDMLNSDFQLKHEATSRQHQSGKKGQDSGDPEAGFHFIAFVPALGKVWKFDGLERQPQAIGHCVPGQDWLDLVKPDILTRMTSYAEEQIEFSILSLTRDPLSELGDKLAVNFQCLEMLDRRLGQSHSYSQEPLVAKSNLEVTLLGSDASYGLTRERIDQVRASAEQRGQYETCTLAELVQHREKLSQEQQELRHAIREEQQSHQADDDYAAGRRFDYEPAVRVWVRLLARKGVIKALE